MGQLNKRFTGYGTISPGAHPERGQSKRKPSGTPKQAGVGRDPNAAIKREIKKMREQVEAIRGAKVMKRRTGK